MEKGLLVLDASSVALTARCKSHSGCERSKWASSSSSNLGVSGDLPAIRLLELTNFAALSPTKHFCNRLLRPPQPDVPVDQIADGRDPFAHQHERIVEGGERRIPLQIHRFHPHPERGADRQNVQNQQNGDSDYRRVPRTPRTLVPQLRATPCVPVPPEWPSRRVSIPQRLMKETQCGRQMSPARLSR